MTCIILESMSKEWFFLCNDFADAYLISFPMFSKRSTVRSLQKVAAIIILVMLILSWIRIGTMQEVHEKVVTSDGQGVSTTLDDNDSIKSIISKLFTTTESFQLKPRQSYSSVDCIIDPEQVPRCFFSNVRFVNHSIVFYENPKEPLAFIQSGTKYEFPLEFIRIRSGTVRFSPFCKPDYNTHQVPVIKVTGPIPEQAEYVPYRLSYLMNPFWPENQGHWLIDDLFASFVNLLEWGVYADDLQYVITKGCNEYFPDYDNNNPENRNCREFYLHRTKGMTKTKPLFLQENPYPEGSPEHADNQHSIELYQYERLFFQNLLMGQSTFSFCETSIRNAFHWRIFRDVFLEQSGITIPAIKNQHITILKKKGKRNIVNFEEMVEWSKSLGVSLTVLDPLETSWEEQLSIIVKTTLLITVPGGISFTSGFLQPQAVGMFFDAWSYRDRRTFPLEGFWWESLSAFKYARYSYEEDEAVFPPGLVNHDEIPEEIMKGCVIISQISSKELECMTRKYTDIRVDRRHYMQVVCELLTTAKQRFGLSAESIPEKCNSIQ
jgi:hypothetical protein